MTISVLARLLSNQIGSPIRDLTAVTGAYDVDLSWRLDPDIGKAERFAQANPGPVDLADAAGAPRELDDLFTSVRKRLGLRLQPEKLPVDVLVIEHIERVPVGN